MASSRRLLASSLIENSGIVFLRYFNIAADTGDHTLVIG